MNDANQRTKRTDADNSYWDYGYDSLGQVTNAVRRWADGTLVAGQQYGYQFDDIGNRQRSEVSGQRSDYTANLLNQYTQRTVPGFVNLLGSAATNATVTVNGATATRQGEYFHSELALANTNNAAYSPVAITANMTSGTNNLAVTNTGHAFLPKTPEQFTHDADGNLTQDGRWQYTWDAENRLLAIETLPNLPTNVPVQKLLFQYDAQSRRISKVVSNYAGSTWTEISNLKFVYDQWNLLSELSVVSNQFSVVRSYAWGLDLSGTEQGAGGIGGLLFGTFNGTSSTSSVAYAFDGNGNVTSLLDMRTGQLAAEYEYSPFGETIRATGPLAKENPFRFSTKRTDDTTGLVLYEYRAYQPSTGRWLSRHPVEEAGGVNLTAFLGNSATGPADSLGDSHLLQYNTSSLQDTAASLPPKGLRSDRGLTECIHATGVPEITHLEEYCKGDCVKQHEEKHVVDLTPCCKRLAKCIHNSPGDAITCAAVWNAYQAHYEDWFECRAYTVAAKCALTTWKRNCCPDNKSRGDCQCCDGLFENTSLSQKRRSEHCALAKAKHIYWGSPKCPFDDNGKILAKVLNGYSK